MPQELIRHKEGHYAPVFTYWLFGYMCAFFDEHAGALSKFPGLVILVKDPPAADYIDDEISFNKEFFFLLNLWTFILGKQQIPAGQIEG